MHYKFSKTVGTSLSSLKKKTSIFSYLMVALVATALIGTLAMGSDTLQATGYAAAAAPLCLLGSPPAATGGDGPAAPAPPATDPTKAEDTPPPPPATTLQKVKAAVQSKGTILAERDDAQARATAAEAELATLKATVETLTAENATLKTEQAEIEKALTESKAANTTVEVKAQEKIVELGVAPDALPESQASSPETLEELQAQMEATTDPKEKGKLAAKCKELRWA